MTVNEIFEKISARQIEGMMFHNDMADYYDFLGLKGYKRMHECQYLCESKEMRCTHRYFINHYGKMIRPVSVNSESHIPMIWFDYTRMDVEPDSKREAVRSSVEKWVNWEAETKRIYEELYTTAMNLGEVATALKIGELVKCVNKEHKKAMRLNIYLRSINYDLGVIFELQDGIHDKYKARYSL